MPGDALMRYTIPMPDDSRIPGRNAEEMPLNGSVLSTVRIAGPEGWRRESYRPQRCLHLHPASEVGPPGTC